MKYSRIIAERGGWTWFQTLLQTLNDVGSQYGVGIAEVASRWVIEKPAVGGLILGARNANHVAQQRQIFSFSLTDADKNRIRDVVHSGNPPTLDVYTFERGGRW